MYKSIETDYIATRKKSQELYRRAEKVMPSGISHDVRYLKPFPYYADRADGARKWDVDGNELLDLGLGHGSLILGHNHPDVIQAVTDQLQKGFHFSANHPLEVELAEMIVRLVPSAEKVRFIQSGAEANALALRIARAYTGKDKIIKFKGHFHGYWSGESFVAIRPPFDKLMSPGVPESALSNVLLAEHNNIEQVRQLLTENNDIACVILDPNGHFTLPLDIGFQEELRRVTKEKGVVLIFDEVFSGFRYAPGGMQEVTGVTPDLTTLAKAVGGGLPASAVAGKAEIMDVVAFSGDREHDRFHRVISQGTHSGNPMVCASGLATLKVLSTGEHQAHMNSLGVVLRKGMNEVINKLGLSGCCYGHHSMAITFLEHNCPLLGKCDTESCTCPDLDMLDAGTPAEVRRNLHLSMLLNGVDPAVGGSLYCLCAVNTEADIENIVQAFDASLGRLVEEGIVKRDARK